MPSTDIDVAIIGGGPGASVTASILRRNNCSVAIIEKSPFPRFQIGESLLPASMNIFKEIGFFEKLNAGHFIRKFGARFVHFQGDEELYINFRDSKNSDLDVAFEVEREHFDEMLLAHAKELGTQVFQPEKVNRVEIFDKFVLLKTEHREIRAKYLVDASGRSCVWGNSLQIKKTSPRKNRVAVFAHFEGIPRALGEKEGDITIGVLPHQSWAWLIPFKGKKTSVGIVANAEEFNPSMDAERFIVEGLSRSSNLRHELSEAKRVSDTRCVSNYSHRCEPFLGNRWILVGDALGFIDPIFSSGVHLSVSSAALAGRSIVEALSEECSLPQTVAGSQYQPHLITGCDRFESLIDMFYETEFVTAMQKVVKREHMQQAFSAVVAGDVWNDDNPLFKLGVL